MEFAVLLSLYSFVVGSSVSFFLVETYFKETAQHWWYGDGAGNTVEENFSIFSLIWMH